MRESFLRSIIRKVRKERAKALKNTHLGEKKTSSRSAVQDIGTRTVNATQNNFHVAVILFHADKELQSP